ncbi:hypothetical protein O3P69_013370 [Scylla paramamosain]|uniref:Uncharacterized protein n=1 Tax=Scylla paramamosain TaxID=85552 RepID=A0AAW0TZV1_SCYPA
MAVYVRGAAVTAAAATLREGCLEARRETCAKGSWRGEVREEAMFVRWREHKEARGEGVAGLTHHRTGYTHPPILRNTRRADRLQSPAGLLSGAASRPATLLMNAFRALLFTQSLPPLEFRRPRHRQPQVSGRPSLLSPAFQTCYSATPVVKKENDKENEEKEEEDEDDDNNNDEN